MDNYDTQDPAIENMEQEASSESPQEAFELKFEEKESEIIQEVKSVAEDCFDLAQEQLIQPVDEYTPEVSNLVDESINLFQMATNEIGSLKNRINPRLISQEIDQEGRKNIATYLKESRDLQLEAEARENSLKGKLLRIINSPDTKLNEINSRIEEHEENGISNLSDLLGLEKQDLKSSEKKEYENPTIKELVSAYYEKISNTPLENDEKRDLLKLEVLANLETDEYIKLWKRLNPYFLSHVTRQGFRDHIGMVYHSAGVAEYTSGFTNIMDDEAKIASPLELEGLKSRNKESVRKWLGDWVLEGNEEQAMEKLHNLIEFHLASAPKYPDKTAIHFMAEVVGNDYYGAESNNEVFFIFPSDVIASQYNYAFNGREKDFTTPQSEMKWNDVFVWPKESDNQGIMIDAGFVFLPNSALVDPETGSKYESKIIHDENGEEKRILIEDESIFNKYIQLYREITNDSSNTTSRMMKGYKEGNILLSQVKGSIYDNLKSLDIDKDSLSELLELTFMNLYLNSSLDDEALVNVVKKTGAHFLRAKNPILAKTYWEKVFQDNPKRRPKHVIFYDGDPTRAIYKFLKDNEIGKADTSLKDGKLLGFDDHHIENILEDPRSNIGKEELIQMAREIIREHYQNPSSL
ncbi:MAG: hypothetical protein PHP08_04155 [Candidatus Dojkabacteria bacterium]|nr:hypothetical protein [Candidatus Dojkabacteria bacterium]